MYPHPDIALQLAKQRREEFLRDAEALHVLNSEDRRSSLTNSRAFLGDLLVDQPFPANTQPGWDILLDQAHSDAALRVRGLVALALGMLAGSLLDSRFGLAPAVLVDGAVVAVLIGLVVSRAIGLRKMRGSRHSH